MPAAPDRKEGGVITVAVLGLAMNPPHLGHLDAIEQLLGQADEVLVVPSAAHAFGKPMAAFPARLDMARLLAARSTHPDRVRVADIEAQMLAEAPGKPVYTFDLLSRLDRQERRTGVRYVCAVGPDNAREEVWNRFHRAGEILERFGRVVVEDRLAVRSSAIRAALGAHRANLSGMTTPEVAQYIGKHHLYRTKTSEDEKRN